MTSEFLGKRPWSCFENSSLPSATTLNTPLSPLISFVSMPNSSEISAARLVAWG